MDIREWWLTKCCFYLIILHVVNGVSFKTCPRAETAVVPSGSAKASVVWVPPVIDGSDLNIAQSQDHKPGDLFPIGNTTVTYTALNFSDTKVLEKAVCSFVVTVLDLTPPLIQCPYPITLSIPRERFNITLNWATPTTFDNSGTLVVNSTHEPGDQFPPGVTEVTYTARDPSGNHASCFFNISLNAIDHQTVTTHKGHETPTSHRTHGLPTSHITHGVPTSHRIHGLPTSHQTHGVPTSHRTHGFPTSHQTHGVPTSHKTHEGILSHRPHGTISHRPHGIISHKPHGTMSHRPHGTISHKPHGTMSHRPHGTISHKTHGTISHRPHDTMSHRPHGTMSHKTHGTISHKTHGTISHKTHGTISHKTHGTPTSHKAHKGTTSHKTPRKKIPHSHNNAPNHKHKTHGTKIKKPTGPTKTSKSKPQFKGLKPLWKGKIGNVPKIPLKELLHGDKSGHGASAGGHESEHHGHTMHHVNVFVHRNERAIEIACITFISLVLVALIILGVIYNKEILTALRLRHERKRTTFPSTSWEQCPQMDGMNDPLLNQEYMDYPKNRALSSEKPLLRPGEVLPLLLNGGKKGGSKQK